MKINPITMVNHTRMVNNTSEVPVNPDLRVKRIPPHKEKLDYLVRTYGEKELKRLGVLECATCAARTRCDDFDEKAGAKAEDGEMDSLSIAVCPECGRRYVVGGGAKTVTKCRTIYEASLELFEGLRVDEKV